MTKLSHGTGDLVPDWRVDVDALTFRPAGHGGICMVHRHAFRTLLRRYPSPQDCAGVFHDHAAAFQDAATAKIARTGIAADANLHLTSRDLARALASSGRSVGSLGIDSNPTEIGGRIGQIDRLE